MSLCIAKYSDISVSYAEFSSAADNPVIKTWLFGAFGTGDNRFNSGLKGL